MSNPGVSHTPKTRTADLWRLFPLLLFAAAFLLRIFGIDWALPDSQRYFSYHPDESRVVSAALTVNPLLLKLDPQFYNYGSLALLLQGTMIFLGKTIGVVVPEVLPGVPSASALLSARLVTVVLGAGTSVLLYHAGRLLYGLRAGAWAGSLYALAPLAVQHGHFATVDVPATFFVTGALLFAARHLSPEHRLPRDLFWAGLWAGFAAATKYNAGLALFAAAAACLLARKSDSTLPPFFGKGGALLVGSAAAGFLLGCPVILLNPAGVLGDIAFEAQHVREGHGIVFTDTAPALVYHLIFNLRWGLGWPLLIVSIAGIGYALYRRRPGDLVLLAFFVPYYLVIGMAQVKFARYLLPLFPPLLLWVGALVPARSESRFALLAQGGVAAAGAYALLLACAFNGVMMRPDTRDRAAAFIRAKQIPSVGFALGPWYFSPPLNPFIASYAPLTAKMEAARNENPRLYPALMYRAVVVDGIERQRPEATGWDLTLLEQTNPDSIAMSEYEYADAERIQEKTAVPYIARLRQDYPQTEIFGSPLQVFGIPFTNITGTENRLPAQGLPHDMYYANPTTIVWTR